MKSILVIMAIFLFVPIQIYTQSLQENSGQVKLIIKTKEDNHSISQGDIVPIQFSYESIESESNVLSIYIFDAGNYTETKLLAINISGKGEGELNYPFLKKGKFKLILKVTKESESQKRVVSTDLIVN